MQSYILHHDSHTAFSVWVRYACDWNTQALIGGCASTKCSPEEAWGVKDQEIVDTMECSTLSGGPFKCYSV